MQDTATIYWDKVGGCHHVVMCTVQDNGEHSVRQSIIASNVGTDLDKLMKYWESVVGAANVHDYNVVQYMGRDAGRYGFTST